MTSCIPDDLRQYAKPPTSLAAEGNAVVDTPAALDIGPKSVEASHVTPTGPPSVPADAEASTTTKTGFSLHTVDNGVTDSSRGDSAAATAAVSGGAAATDEPAHAKSSIFARDENAPVHVVPMRVIHRPLPSELDEDKVQSFMEEMKAGDVFTPIEVIKVRAPLKTDPNGTVQNFYFSMGGCHRYEATKRLGLPNIRARIIEVPPAAMRMYLGAGSPF